MPRKKKIESEAAIAAALGVFWQSGYAGAGTRDIEEQTGITKFTLQKTYGGKEGLFLETLDAYLDAAEARHFPRGDTFDLEDLAKWFEDLVSPAKMPLVDQAGCLAFNSIAGFDRGNDAVNARVERYLNGFESRVTQILQRAAEAGQLKPGLEVAPLANLLVTQLLGLHVLIKARPDDRFMKQYGSACAALIRGWTA